MQCWHSRRLWEVFELEHFGDLGPVRISILVMSSHIPMAIVIRRYRIPWLSWQALNILTAVPSVRHAKVLWNSSIGANVWPHTPHTTTPPWNYEPHKQTDYEEYCDGNQIGILGKKSWSWAPSCQDFITKHTLYSWPNKIVISLIILKFLWHPYCLEFDTN